MSISQTTPDTTTSGNLGCPNCHALLPPHAAFCSSCGERIDKKKHVTSLLQDESEITTRYRITSLVRRRPYVNLYFALDNQQQVRQGQQRMVAIRDIDITPLEDQVRVGAIELLQQEYDLLRRWQVPYVMPVIHLRYFQGHLFVITGKPSTREGAPDAVPQTEEQQMGADTGRLYTLQDFLQSGQGLPSEQRTLEWIGYLCHALDRLHRHQIVVGDLDPYTIILTKNSDDAQPMLMVSWLLPQLRTLLPPPTSSRTQMSYFSAPEALLGKADPRSDIYSLGAILYLLLTGTPPDESALRTRHRLRAPHELNSRISPHVDECVMQALSVDPFERFQSVAAMAEALRNPRYRRPLTGKPARQDREVEHVPTAGEDVGDVETVRIVPLSQKNVARWQAARPHTRIPQRPLSPRSVMQPEQTEAIETEWDQQRSPQFPSNAAPSTLNAAQPDVLVATSSILSEDASFKAATESTTLEERPTSPILISGPYGMRQDQHAVLTEAGASHSVPSRSLPLQAPQRSLTWWQRVIGILVAIVGGQARTGREKREQKEFARSPMEEASQTSGEISWFQQLQRVILGQQQRTTTAAAIVETPMRVQPNQSYTIRMHLMGRDEPVLPPGAEKGALPAGLSALIHGDKVSIEVRSALHQSYAYIVQQAIVTIPADGYVAEVTIPMQPLSNGPSGRRDRLHVFFLDEQRQPLYEKPFVVELFVSHLVQPGREGHNVLTIPL